MFAAMLFCVGVLPLISIGSSIGAQGPQARLLAVIVAACCLVMALRWLRLRWPSRAESALHVVTGTLCVAVVCVIQANPVVGLLSATTFAMSSAYIALFHTARLLAFTWTVAAVTLGFLAVRLAAVDPALAVAGVVLVALVNIFVAFACRLGVRLLGSDVLYGELEALTGLLNRDAFYQRTATLLAARSRDDDRYLVVVVVSIDSFSLLTGTAGLAAGDRARVEVGQALRENVRRETIVAHIPDADFLIAETFTSADPSPLIERLRGAITTKPSRLAATIGVVSTPLKPLSHHPPQDVLDEVLTLATAAMYEARQSGGNQARYVLNPALSILNDPDIEGPRSR